MPIRISIFQNSISCNIKVHYILYCWCDGVLSCVYLGRHSVAVILDGEPVKGSPFACNIYDVSKVRITGLGPSKVCLVHL